MELKNSKQEKSIAGYRDGGTAAGHDPCGGAEYVVFRSEVPRRAERA
jgi:hypothetical protein